MMYWSNQQSSKSKIKRRSIYTLSMALLIAALMGLILPPLFTNVGVPSNSPMVADRVALFVDEWLTAPTALAAPSLGLSVTVTPSAVEPGETVEYVIRYRCASLTEHCLDAEITHTLPSGFVVNSFSQAGGNIVTATQSGSTITWDMGTLLPAGSTGILSVRGAFPACASGGATAGLHTATTTFQANGATTNTINTGVTLNTSVPTCPTIPAPVPSFVKEDDNGFFLLDGRAKYSLQFPDNGGVPYTVTDNFPDEFVPSYIQADDNMFLEIECADSGVYHAIGLGRDLNDPSDLTSLSAPECTYVDHPTVDGRYLFNVTSVRWNFTTDFTGDLDVDFGGYLYVDNPFDGITVTLPTVPATVGDALPNWTSAAALEGSEFTNCMDSSLGSQACKQTDIMGSGVAPTLDKQLLGSPSTTWNGAPSTTNSDGSIEYDGVALDVAADGTLLDPTATAPLVQQRPSDMIYMLVVSHAWSSEPWKDPYIVDLLPPELLYTADNWTVVNIENESDYFPSGQTETLSYADPDCQNPTISVMDDHNDTGRQLVAWDFSGCTIETGHPWGHTLLRIYFSVTIKPGTLEGTFMRNFGMAVGDFVTLDDCDGGGAADAIEHGPYWPYEVDVTDLDGDSDTGEAVCRGDSIDYTIPAVATLESSKYVQGALDTELSRYPIIGTTDLSGLGTYQFEILHSGNITVTEFDVVDILPYIGDSDVSGFGQARLSDWAMQLTGDILIERSLDDGATWSTVSAADLLNGAPAYAASTNPCIYDVDPPDGDDLSITGSFPTSCTALSTSTPSAGATSFGFRFVPADPFMPGERLRVTFQAAINGNPPGCDDPDCVGDTLNVSAISWNSFAFAGFYENAAGSTIRMLDTEPIKTGLKMVDPDTTTSLGNYIWHDEDGDGLQDSTETPLVGVTVNLYAADGTTLIASTLTDGNGFYHFLGLDPSTTYVVKLDNSADYTSGVLSGMRLTSADVGGDDTIDSDGVYNLNNHAVITATTGIITGIEDLADPTEYPTNDFGFWLPASIGDTIWYDLDGFGDQDEAYGVDGVTVNLYAAGADGLAGTADDSLIDTTTTNANGDYLFDDIAEGNYFLTFDYSTISDTHPISDTVVNAVDFQWTIPTATGNSHTDSDAVATSGTLAQSAVTYLSSGEHDPTWDGGLTYAPPPGNIVVGDLVWEDRNANGLWDGVNGPDGIAGNSDDEPGISGVQVQLLDGSGLPIDITYTDSTGNYQFADLDDGTTYEIIFITPSGTSLTAANTGSDETVDSDADPATGSTGTFAPDHTRDGGAASDGTDYSWDAGIVPTLSLGNIVWNDADNNGFLDSGESGIAGLTVNLLNSGGTVITSTVTDASGRYLFTALAPGDYFVEVEQPSGYHPSSINTTNPNDGVDLDSNGVSEVTAGYIRSNAITLAYGTAPTSENDHGVPIDGVTDATLNIHANYTLDFGFFQPLEIGNYIWLDSDRDGEQDAGESGIDGVIVELVNIATGTVTNTVTSGGGFYLFTQLAAGDYIVRIPASNFAIGGVLADMVSTSIDYDNNQTRPVYDPDVIDADSDNNGYDPNGLASLTSGTTSDIDSAVVTLSNGAEPTTDEAPTSGILDIDSNTAVDFGFIDVFVQIGDLVWIEDDGDGNAATGTIIPVANTVVTATSSSGVIYTATTDSNGNYAIIVPISDTYTVTVATAADAAPAGVLIANDSDPNSNDGFSHDGSGTLTTVVVTDNLTIDFGFFVPISSLALEKTLLSPTDGIATVSDALTFQLQITNTGSVTITELNLIDSYDSTILQYITASIAPDAQTAGSITWMGDYGTGTGSLLPNLPLAPGATFSITVNMEAIAPTRP